MRSQDRTMLASMGFADPDKGDERHDLACRYLALPENHERLARSLIEPAWKRLSGPGSDKTWVDGRGHVEFSFVRSFGSFRIVRPSIEHVLSKGEGQYRTTVGFLDVTLPFKFDETREGSYRRVVEEQSARVTIEHSIWCDLFPSESPNAFTFVPVPVDKLSSVVDPSVLTRSRGRPARVLFKGSPGSNDGDGVLVSIPQYREDTVPRTECHEHHCRIVVEVKTGRVGAGAVLRQIKLYRQFYEADFWVLATPYQLLPDDVATLHAEGIKHIRLGPKFDAWVTARAKDAPAESEEL